MNKKIVCSIVCISVLFCAVHLNSTRTKEVKASTKLVESKENETKNKEKDVKNENVKVEKKEQSANSETSNEKAAKDEITVFSSKTTFKKVYYVNADKINIYQKSDINSKVIGSLSKNNIVISYKEENGFVFCEDIYGRNGWIKKDSNNLKGNLEKNTTYIVDVDVTNQKIKVFLEGKVIREIICATGRLGDQDTETPIGNFYVYDRGAQFYSEKYAQGGKYYVQFFGDYLIHSVPIDINGNIIEEEKNRLGQPISHGCIRVPLEDSKWLYEYIPNGSLIKIHY